MTTTLSTLPAAPSTPLPALWSCGCGADKDVERLRDLMAGGMSQWEASVLIWSPRTPPAGSLAVRDPGRWARRYVRAALATSIPWLRLPTPTEVS